MEPEGSLPCSQEPTTCPYPEIQIDCGQIRKKKHFYAFKNSLVILKGEWIKCIPKHKKYIERIMYCGHVKMVSLFFKEY
jgi:hypothetical protein